MQTFDDAELLRLYVTQKSEKAFETLVRRHVNVVYSSALRQVRNPHTAEEVTQAVFIILARKAHKVRTGTPLIGWLLNTVRFASSTEKRTTSRRLRHEQEALMYSKIQTEAAGAVEWDQIAPYLDDALAQLVEKDRNAVVLRFFEKKPLAEVGRALGVTPDTAQKRISRAVDKLRGILTKRGMALSAVSIISLLSANAVQAAPVNLPSIITTAAALHGAATVTTSTTTLINGTIKLMAWTKLKTTLVIGAGLLLATGTTSVIVTKVFPASRNIAWGQGPSVEKLIAGLEASPRIIYIRPTKFPGGGGSFTWHGRMLSENVSIKELIGDAYLTSGDRTIFPSDLPRGNYDVLLNLSKGNTEGLRAELKRQFGLYGHRETRDVEVLLLRVSARGMRGIKSVDQGTPGYSSRRGYFSMNLQPMRTLVDCVAQNLQQPVFDETGLMDRYNVELNWEASDPTLQNESLKQKLDQQLGLELVPAIKPLEMLIVEKGR